MGQQAHGTEKMSKNLQAYLRLNKARFKDQYVVLVDGKLVAKGKAIEKILKQVRKAYPRKVPFVAKVPGDEVLVL
jgi:glutamine phosphoribosylpyrophosphate amidotransferase